jgi:hypothetical protein
MEKLQQVESLRSDERFFEILVLMGNLQAVFRELYYKVVKSPSVFPHQAKDMKIVLSIQAVSSSFNRSFLVRESLRGLSQSPDLRG